LVTPHRQTYDDFVEELTDSLRENGIGRTGANQGPGTGSRASAPIGMSGGAIYTQAQGGGSYGVPLFRGTFLAGNPPTPAFPGLMQRAPVVAPPGFAPPPLTLPLNSAPCYRDRFNDYQFRPNFFGLNLPFLISSKLPPRKAA
jgi:hypothetical protein